MQENTNDIKQCCNLHIYGLKKLNLKHLKRLI